MSNEKAELIDKFSKWILELEFELLQDKLFQPIGIELSALPVVIDTIETTKFQGIGSDDLGMMPIAYYDPQEDKIHIFIEHKEFKKREHSESDQKSFLMFLLFHEACHRLLMTMPRLNERDMMLWNIATDYEIHNMLYVYYKTFKSRSSSFQPIISNFMEHINSCLFEKTDDDACGLFEKDFLQLIAEEIYQYLLNSKEEETQTFTFYGNGTASCSSSGSSGTSTKGKKNSNKKDKNDAPKDDENDDEDENEEQKDVVGSIRVKVSKYKLPNGKKITTSNVEYSSLDYNNKSKEEQEQDQNNTLVRKTMMENSLRDEMEKNKGNIPQECQMFIKKMFHVKIDWKKILRNSLKSILEKSDNFTWAKPRLSLFGMPNAPYLPAQEENAEKYGVLIVARDESGSMSENDLAKAAGIIAEAKEHYKKIIIIKHDTDIVSIDEFEELNDDARKILLTRGACGGTSHKKVFEWIKDYYVKHKNDDENKISCVIYITDMYSDIEEYQDIVPTQVPEVYLTTVNEKHTDKIKGLIIPVE